MSRSTSNKEKIREAAIVLFSERGYEHVTMREIATFIGIKAPSIYNHYKSKKHIMTEIMNHYRVTLKQILALDHSITKDTTVPHYLHAVSTSWKRMFFEPELAKTTKLLLREQYHDSEIQNLFYEELVERPRDDLKEAFQGFMNQGKMKKGDPLFLAKEFHSFFIYQFYENSMRDRLFSQDLFSEDSFDERRHVTHFIDSFALDTPSSER